MTTWYAPFVVFIIWPFRHSWLISGFVTRVTRRCHMCNRSWLLSGAAVFTPGFSRFVLLAQCLGFLCNVWSLCEIKWWKKYHTGNITTSNAHCCLLSWSDTGTSIKCGGLNLLYWSQPLLVKWRVYAISRRCKIKIFEGWISLLGTFCKSR